MKSSPQPANASTTNPAGGKDALISGQLLEKGRLDAITVLQQLASRLDGLTQAEADARLKQYGLNTIAQEQRLSGLMRLLGNVRNPLVLLLVALGVLSFLTGDLRATVVIFVMVILGIVLRFVQESLAKFWARLFSKKRKRK